MSIVEASAGAHGLGRRAMVAGEKNDVCDALALQISNHGSTLFTNFVRQGENTEASAAVPDEHGRAPGAFHGFDLGVQIRRTHLALFEETMAADNGVRALDRAL